MKAVVTVMLKDGVLDPQGRAIGQALGTLGFAGVGEVRAGKVIELELAETDPSQARATAEAMAHKLLANTVIESYRVEVAGAPKKAAKRTAAAPRAGKGRSTTAAP